MLRSSAHAGAAQLRTALRLRAGTCQCPFSHHLSSSVQWGPRSGADSTHPQQQQRRARTGWHTTTAATAAGSPQLSPQPPQQEQQDAAAGPQQQQQQAPLEAALYVVGTPIGNLEDMSFRAVRILQSVHLILAEDTRHTRNLLEHFAIRTPTLSCHQHNERQRQALVLQRLQQGEPIALVSDAGMPGISDPGAVIVAAAVAEGVRVVPVPGPCAAVAALAAAGLPTDQFYFVGFLPPKSGRRQAALAQLRQVAATLVMYAPPHALGSILADACEVLGGSRQAVVARELTKLHEEFFRGTLQDALGEFGPDGRRPAVKGEVVLLVEGAPDDAPLQQLMAAATAAAESAAAAGGSGAGATDALSADDAARVLVAAQLAAGATVSGAAKTLARRLAMPRGKLYKLALELQQQQQEQQ